MKGGGNSCKVSMSEELIAIILSLLGMPPTSSDSSSGTGDDTDRDFVRS